MVKIQYPSVFGCDVSIHRIRVARSFSTTVNKDCEIAVRLTSAANVAVLSRRDVSDIVCPRSESVVVAD
jgi:hypothetical protein